MKTEDMPAVSTVTFIVLLVVLYISSLTTNEVRDVRCKETSNIPQSLQ